MKLELRRVDPLRAANITAIVYGVTMAIFALIASPFFLLAALLSPSRGEGLAGAFVGVFFIIIYPVIGVVMGWISGLIMAGIYNIIVKWTGGLLVEFDGTVPGTDPAGRSAGVV